MRYALLSLLLLLGACAGLGLSVDEARPVVDEVMAVAGPPIAAVFEKHNLPPEAGAQFLAAMKQALEGMLTTGADWWSIMENIAVIGFNALLGLFGLRKGAPLIGKLVALLRGVFQKKVTP